MRNRTQLQRHLTPMNADKGRMPFALAGFRKPAKATLDFICIHRRLPAEASAKAGSSVAKKALSPKVNSSKKTCPFLLTDIVFLL